MIDNWSPAATHTPLQLLVRWTAPVRGAVVAGAVAGVIAAGAGSRIAMRIIAVINDDRDGVLTDASATVGDISAGGTMALLVLGTIAGVFGGIAYVALRRWLWVPQPWRGVAFAAVTLATVGHLLFDTHNVDFQMFQPIGVVIALFAALFLINGLLLAPLADRIHPEPVYPAGIAIPRTAAAAIALVTLAGAALMVDTYRTMFDEAGSCYAARGGGNGCAVLDDGIDP